MHAVGAAALRSAPPPLAAAAATSSRERQRAPAAAAAAAAAGGGKIALLLPETKTARYESQDRPHFEAKVKELCADCQIIYSNADQDAAKQQQQAEAALTNGAKVLVLDPVDSASAAAIVDRAKQSKIPVICYDRLITERRRSTTTSRSTTSRSASCRARPGRQAQEGRQGAARSS